MSILHNLRGIGYGAKNMRKNMVLRKVSAAFTSVVLCAGILTGCAGNGNTPAASVSSSAQTPAAEASADAGTQEQPAAAGGETTIRIAWWGNQIRNDTTMAMLEAYTAEHPNVKFEPEFTDWSGYWDKLATQAASNNLPDIIQQDYAYIAQYYTKNQLANLSEYTESGKIDISNVSDSILSLGSFDGNLYALCAGVNAVGMFYNARMAADAGVEVPLRLTYEDVAEISNKVFEATGIKSFSPGGNGAITMMSRDVGEVFFDVENNKIGSSEATVLRYFNHVKSTIESPWHLSVDVLQESSTAGVEANPISVGTGFNLFPGGSNQLAAHQAPIEDELNVVMWPTLSDATQESMYLRPSMFWSIIESSSNKDTAADVINYYTNNEKAQELLKAERGVPVSSVMAEYLKPQLDEVQQKIFNYIAEVTKVAVPFDPPQPAGANEVNKLLDDLTDLIRYGELTPEEAAARFLPEANDILAKVGA